MSTRITKPEELTDLVDMVSTCFSYNMSDAEDRISRDFPLLFAPENNSHLHIYTEADSAGVEKIVSHAGCFNTLMRTDGLEIPVGGIGGVSTIEGFQGKGLASALVDSCCKDLNSRGAVLAFLWTGNHDFYRKQGFELVARQWIITLDQGFIPAIKQHLAPSVSTGTIFECRELVDTTEREKYFPEAYAKLAYYPLGIKRSYKQFCALLSSKGCRMYGAFVAGKLRAYFVEGKGKDLLGYIHEWAGDDRGLLSLLCFSLEETKKELKILTPQFTPDEAPWIYTLDNLGAPMQAEHMAMVKILNFPILQAMLVKRVGAMGLDTKDFHISRAPDGYQIGWGNDLFPGLTEHEFLALVFGPEPPKHDVLGAIFPLRLWWWGMDSV